MRAGFLLAAFVVSALPLRASADTTWSPTRTKGWKCLFSGIEEEVRVARTNGISGGAVYWAMEWREASFFERNEAMTFVRFTSTGGAIVVTIRKGTGEALISRHVLFDFGPEPRMTANQNKGTCT